MTPRHQQGNIRLLLVIFLAGVALLTTGLIISGRVSFQPFAAKLNPNRFERNQELGLTQKFENGVLHLAWTPKEAVTSWEIVVRNSDTGELYTPPGKIIPNQPGLKSSKVRLTDSKTSPIKSLQTILRANYNSSNQKKVAGVTYVQKKTFKLPVPFSPHFTPLTSRELTWAPPGYPDYSGYQHMEVSDNNYIFQVDPDKNIDAILTFKEKVTHPMKIDGYRNVIILGGEIEINSSEPNGVNGLQLYRISKFAHLEGLYIHGTGIRDGIGVVMGRRPPKTGGILRLQNVRIEQNVTNAAVHGDDVQLWQRGTDWPDDDPTKPNPYHNAFQGGLGQIQVDRFTGYAKMQALLLINVETSLEGATVKNANLVGIDGGGQLIGKTARKDNFGRSSILTLDNVWIDGKGSTLTPQDQVIPNSYGTYYGNQAHSDPTRANFLGSDSQGQFVDWPETADVVGVAHIGLPPGGDFVPASTTGVNYISPGYKK